MSEKIANSENKTVAYDRTLISKLLFRKQFMILSLIFIEKYNASIVQKFFKFNTHTDLNFFITDSDNSISIMTSSAD